MRIVMTGATGMLGSELLIEIVKQHLDHLNKLQIFILGRPGNSTLLSRIKGLFESSGFDYLKSSDNNTIKQIRNAIIPIDFDYSYDDTGLTEDSFNKLRKGKIDIFFHIGSLTDLRHDIATQVRLENSNVNGTYRLLKILDRLDIVKLVYISTAYVCGSKTGIIYPNYVDLDQKFRNPYEKTKLKAEILIREYAIRKKSKLYIFRPSLIAGRLLESPIGYTPKFEIFYSWIAWFLRQKYKYVNSVTDLFEETIAMDIRIRVNKNSISNIVPVDYVAKILSVLTCEEFLDTDYHIANHEETLQVDCISWILESIKITGVTLVENEPKDKNILERLYYRSIGKILTPYLVSGPMNFDTTNLKQIEDRLGVTCPRIDQIQFKSLMDYAKTKRFGLDETMLSKSTLLN
ncbi:SDR family oxidoreductase [Candidatus Latescibacterota bacterium]